MTDKVDAMIEAHGWQDIEFVAWEWAAGLDAERVAMAEAVLAPGGVDGIRDLHSVGGVNDADIARLAILADARLAPSTLAS